MAFTALSYVKQKEEINGAAPRRFDGAASLWRDYFT
jgi:hypothetical protein